MEMKKRFLEVKIFYFSRFVSKKRKDSVAHLNEPRAASSLLFPVFSRVTPANYNRKKNKVNVKKSMGDKCAIFNFEVPGRTKTSPTEHQRNRLQVEGVI
jgi:hypothetical protein